MTIEEENARHEAHMAVIDDREERDIFTAEQAQQQRDRENERHARALARLTS